MCCSKCVVRTCQMRLKFVFISMQVRIIYHVWPRETSGPPVLRRGMMISITNSPVLLRGEPSAAKWDAFFFGDDLRRAPNHVATETKEPKDHLPFQRGSWINPNELLYEDGHLISVSRKKPIRRQWAVGFIHFAETDMLAAVRQKASLHKSNLTTPSARTSSTTFISPFPHDTKTSSSSSQIVRRTHV